MASAIGMLFALASEQKSPPGQQMMSVSKPIFGVAKPAGRAFSHKGNRSLNLTSAKIKFCSCETRNSPKLNCSAKSATTCICSEVASPGAWPCGLSDKVTARYPFCLCGCTQRFTQAENAGLLAMAVSKLASCGGKFS